MATLSVLKRLILIKLNIADIHSAGRAINYPRSPHTPSAPTACALLSPRNPR